jgi:DNA polymerase III sliding clamp (beta) subunit (PCNA family)
MPHGGSKMPKYHTEETKMPNATIDAETLARQLKNVSHFTSKGEWRPALTAVQATITDDSVILCATDGYTLLSADICATTAGAGLFLLDPAAVKLVLLVLDKRAGNIEITCETDESGEVVQVTIAELLLEIKYNMRHAKYPDWKPLIPECVNADGVAVIGLSADKLAKFAKVKMPNKKETVLRLSFTDAIKAVNVEFINDESLIAVIMPYKLS